MTLLQHKSRIKLDTVSEFVKIQVLLQMLAMPEVLRPCYTITFVIWTLSDIGPIRIQGVELQPGVSCDC